jgi:hypothetical protein
MTTERLFTWRGVDDPERIDHASIQLGADCMHAIGAAHARSFATAWELDVAPGWVTSALCVTSRGFGWWRVLTLTRSDDGWAGEVETSGDPDLPSPGLGDPDSVTSAIDCDLGLCPVTNTMPIRRLALLEGDVAETPLVMAWVDVPSLRVIRSDQVYGSVPGSAARQVRYTSSRRDFSAKLDVDADGIVTDYPGLAQRLANVR